MWLRKEIDTFGGFSIIIPMSVLLATSRMRLGTVVSAWKQYKSDPNATTPASTKDYFNFNICKFKYIDTVKPKSI
jgi:hypothetical protein